MPTVCQKFRRSSAGRNRLSRHCLFQASGTDIATVCCSSLRKLQPPLSQQAQKGIKCPNNCCTNVHFMLICHSTSRPSSLWGGWLWQTGTNNPRTICGMSSSGTTIRLNLSLSQVIFGEDSTMIETTVVNEVCRMLREGRLSQRQIARRIGVSRGTVNAIALGRRRERSAWIRRRDDDFTPPTGRYMRCPGCGGLAQMPCLACYVRTTRQTARPARSSSC